MHIHLLSPQKSVGYGDICPTSNIPFVGKLFLMWISFMGLGMVCGPLIAVTSSWRHEVPGGWMVVTAMTFGLGILIFTHCEGLSITDAIYASVMTGTTIGFGDVTPNTDIGKFSVAIYALLVVGVVSGMLDTVRDHLVQFCIPPPTTAAILDDSSIWMKQSTSSSVSFHTKRSNGQKSNRKLARIQQQNQVTSSPTLPVETKQSSSSSLPTTIRKRR
jgi:Ion channel